MNTPKKELFIHLWKKYFNDSELPIAFYYANDNNGVPLVEHPEKHRCLISQLNKVRKGESLCFNADSINCVGGKRYLGYSDTFRPRFEQFLSHGNEGEICERYKSSPALVTELLKKHLPYRQKEIILSSKDGINSLKMTHLLPCSFLPPQMS